MNVKRNEYYPWTFDIEEQLANYGLFLLYGKDLAMSFSLSRAREAIFYDEGSLQDNQSVLYTESLFGESNTLRILVSGKVCDQLVKRYMLREFTTKVILIVDAGTIASKHESICYVKCDELNRKTSKSFIDFWNSRLSSSLDRDAPVKNLDELKFALLLQKLGKYEYLGHPGEMQGVWNLIRTEQFRNSKLYQPIYKHLELWARNHVPNEETLQLCYEKVKSEVERFKSEVSKGH